MHSDRLALPVLLILLTVLVPSLGVLWMMREAVRNERLATNQRLQEAYRLQLQASCEQVRDAWRTELRQLEETVNAVPPAQAFKQMVSERRFDAVLILDDAGKVIYPTERPPPVIETEQKSRAWLTASRLEFGDRDFVAALTTYSQIEETTGDPWLAAKARQAQVRCYLQLENQPQAIAVLQRQRSMPDRADWRMQSFSATAELQLLEMLPQESPVWREVSTALQDRLNDYQSNTMPSSRRRFLMAQLEELRGDDALLLTHDAEDIAAQALKAYKPGQEFAQLRPLGETNLWAQQLPNGRVVVLLRDASLRGQLPAIGSRVSLPSGIALVAVGPTEIVQNNVEESLGKEVGYWRLALQPTSDDPFRVTSAERRAVHAWIAFLVVAATGTFAWMLVVNLKRRFRIAQLKNDLVATVSHELKTPLASIRLLVDTLLAGGDAMPTDSEYRRQRDYLQLISDENERLSRLIEKFLTFSRIDSGRQEFDFQQVDARAMVQNAADVACERLPKLGDSLTCKLVDAGFVRADRNAVETAIVNVLENAWKYSGEDKQIRLEMRQMGEQLAIAVHDNGIGMSARDLERSSERFFQADQNVSRAHGGCGLGLSIVKAIVDAHGGDLEVTSRLGEGSVVTLVLPGCVIADERDDAEVTSA